MGSFFQNKANIVTAGLIVLVLIGGGYALISSRQSSGSEFGESFVSVDTQSLPISFGTVAVSGNAGSSNDLISVLSGLRMISLDAAIFKDPVFLSLTDFGIPLQEEQVGRYNPFLPIGSEGVSPAVESQAPSTTGNTGAETSKLPAR